MKRTNLEKFYEKPTKYAAFGLSDHVTIVVKPRARIQNKPVKLTTKSRDMTPNKQYAMTSYLEQVNVSNLINSIQSCEEKISMLEEIVKIGLDAIMPLE